MKYIICYSGGESSAKSALICAKKYGKENIILLNHDIVDDNDGNIIEHHDIKRFKQEIVDYIGIPITYANCTKFKDNTPLGITEELGCIANPTTQQALCTYYLKTEPFYQYLKDNFPVEKNQIREDLKIVYGFDKNESHRITRRVGSLATQGYQCEFPLIDNDFNIDKIGIRKPITYRIYKHANCKGCLKSGRQSWYLTYCLDNAIFEKAKQIEKNISYSIIKDIYLEELEYLFYDMKHKKSICPNEKENAMSFWARVNSTLPEQQSFLPCDCSLN